MEFLFCYSDDEVDEVIGENQFVPFKDEIPKGSKSSPGDNERTKDATDRFCTASKTFY